MWHFVAKREGEGQKYQKQCDINYGRPLRKKKECKGGIWDNETDIKHRFTLEYLLNDYYFFVELERYLYVIYFPL